MDNNFPFPVILRDGKRYAKPYMIAQYATRPVGIITSHMESGEIKPHVFGLAVYVDIDEALAIFAKTKYVPGRRTSPKTKKRLSQGELVDLFS